MAPGWLKKIGNFFRKVGSGIATGVKKAVGWIKDNAPKIIDTAKKVYDKGKPLANTALKTYQHGFGDKFTDSADRGFDIADKYRQKLNM
jgi:hypothetical protein